MTVGAGSGPFGSPFRSSPLTYKVDDVEYFHERPIVIQQMGFTFVAQMRSWLPDPIGGILWFGVDDASMGMYVPLYYGINAIRQVLHPGNADQFTRVDALLDLFDDPLRTDSPALISRLLVNVSCEIGRAHV